MRTGKTRHLSTSTIMTRISLFSLIPGVPVGEISDVLQ